MVMDSRPVGALVRRGRVAVMPAQLWYPEAVTWYGNPDVTGYPDAYAQSVGYVNGQRGPKRGEIKHSAEGENWAVIHDLLHTKSWQFTIGYDRVEQHHAIDVNCWHGADTDNDQGVRANFDLIGVEHLGEAGTPLTPWQTEATIKLSRWLGEQYERDVFRRFSADNTEKAGVWLLAEHKEVSNTYTACPSSRIPWAVILMRLNGPQGGNDVTPAEMREIKDAIAASEARISAKINDLLTLIASVSLNLDKDHSRLEAELAKVPKA